MGFGFFFFALAMLIVIFVANFIQIKLLMTVKPVLNGTFL